MPATCARPHALARALGVPARDWIADSRAPWRWLAPRRLPGRRRAFGARVRARAWPRPPALAIGCGRQAALATRLLRARGARAVQILDPRLATRHWDLVIAPEHDGLHGDNVITLLGSLHPVDDLWLARRAPGVRRASPHLPQPRTALLLGGPSAHARFDDALFDAPARTGSSACCARRRQRAGHGVAPHAGKLVRAGLRERLRGAARRGLVRRATTAPIPTPGLLGWADRIVCTADSVNMLSKRAATRVPVFVAGAERISGRPRRFLDSLLPGARCAFAIWTTHGRRVRGRAVARDARVAANPRASLALAAAPDCDLLELALPRRKSRPCACAARADRRARRCRSAHPAAAARPAIERAVSPRASSGRVRRHSASRRRGRSTSAASRSRCDQSRRIARHQQRRVRSACAQHQRLQQELQVDQPALALLQVEARRVAAIEFGAHAPAHRHDVVAQLARHRARAPASRARTRSNASHSAASPATQRARTSAWCSQVQARSRW